jgi:CGNR zinc finger/Putative stress-induced transcription regulator
VQLERNVRPVAELAARLVNIAIAGASGGKPYEPPSSADQIADFCSRLAPATATEIHRLDDAGERLARMAEAFQPVFTATTMAEVADAVNRLLRKYRSQPYLVDDVGQPFHLHFHGAADTPIESLGGEIAAALALVVDAYGTKRFGQCQASGCDRAYVDLTRNGARRYCSDACNSRMRMAAYRQRATAR